MPAAGLHRAVWIMRGALHFVGPIGDMLRRYVLLTGLLMFVGMDAVLLPLAVTLRCHAAQMLPSINKKQYNHSAWYRQLFLSLLFMP